MERDDDGALWRARWSAMMMERCDGALWSCGPSAHFIFFFIYKVPLVKFVPGIDNFCSKMGSNFVHIDLRPKYCNSI